MTTKPKETQIIVPEERPQRQPTVRSEEPQNQTMAMVQMIERVASNPQVDPEKMQKIMDMQMQILDRESQQAWAAAYASCAKEMPGVAKKAYNTQTDSRFAKMDEIVKAIKPIYAKHGFSLMFYEGKPDKEGWIRIMCDITHELGFTKTRHVDLPPDDSGIKGNRNKTDIHAKGSTFSYGRRYLTCLIFDLETFDDDDGNKGGGKVVKSITKEQVENIEALITEIGIDKAKLLKLWAVEEIEQLPAIKYNNAMNQLEKRRAQGEKK